MDRLITEVFEDECKDLDIDLRFVKKLHAFQVGFVNKNEEHISFFGGHLLGVHKVRFTPTDENYWFEDILQANEYELRERLHKLPGINPEFVVSSDVFNLSAVWLAHAIFNNRKLNEKQREDAMMDVMLLMNYRFLTSRLARFFKYPADPQVAEQTFNKLSYKFAIKQHKTWHGVLVNRSQDIIAKDSLHYKTLASMKSNEDVVAMINDCQGRIRDMIKNIYEVFIETNKQGNRIIATSDVANFDGAEILRDRTNGLNNYTQYLLATISDRGSFIKEDLVHVIERIMPTMPPRLFMETLEWVSAHYGTSKGGIIEETIREIMIHSFGYLADHRSMLNNSVDLVGLLDKLKGIYTSSRSTDPTLLTLREKCEEIAFLATGNKNKNVLPSLRTGLMLYLVSRAFTKNHFS